MNGFFCYHEDVDLAFRMQLAGGECVQSADAICLTMSAPPSPDTVPEFAVYHGTRNRIWTFYKNMPLLLMILLTPAHIGGKPRLSRLGLVSQRTVSANGARHKRRH